MPQIGAKHTSQRVVQLDTFVGGMNQSVPATQIADNECQLIHNMYLDRVSGRPRSRYPMTRFSSSVPSYGPGPITSLYRWHNEFIFSCNQYLYRLDSTGGTPSYIGSLNSSTRPTYCPYNNNLIVASGGTMQYTTSNYYGLSDVVNGKTCFIVMERNSRVAATGNSTYPDRIWEATYMSETTWGSSDYADVGYLDGTSVIGLAEAFEGMYIVFKRGPSSLKTYYCTTLAAASPQAALVSEGHAAHTHASVVSALSKLFVIEKHFISSLQGTDAQGKVVYDTTPGLKLAAAFTASAEAFAVGYPRDGQIWFVPDPKTSEIYVYHYQTGGAWTKFSFRPRMVYSACYDPITTYLYLGCEDGYIYKYDWSDQSYVDTAGAYTQTLITKIFTGTTREIVVKAPIISWSSLTSGSGTVYIMSDYGSETKFTQALTLATFQVYVYDTRAAGSDPTYVYDTRVGGSDERYVYADYSDFNHQVADYNDVMDNLQIKLEVTSGALALERIVLEVADSRRVT